jgi:myo-inositol-1(or 4)-monophosphatase
VSDFADLLPQLARIVQEAGQIAQREKQTLIRDNKPDGSIVTNGDRAVEKFLREKLTHLIPDSSVWGEEFGFEEEDGKGLWLVDPIDGTSNYSFGSPLWGVSVGFLKNNTLELGAVALPDLNELYLAAKNHGVTLNGAALKPIRPGPVTRQELVSYTEKVMRTHPVLPGKMRNAGAFVIDGCFVASQRYRGLIGFQEKLYDVAPCILFGLELGADIRYADGTPFELGGIVKDRKIDKPWLIFPSESGFLLSGS